MRIANNINELTLKRSAGVKTYTYEIVKALAKVDSKNEYSLYLSRKSPTTKELADFYRWFSSSGNFKIKTIDSSFPFWTYTKLPQEIRKDNPDILFMPIQSSPFFRKPEDIKLVVTVHDLAFLIFPDYFTLKDRFLLSFHTKRAVEAADKIIAPSEATKKDIEKFYDVAKDKIEVVYHGAGVGSLSKESQKSKFELAEPYILFVGSIQPRKNIVRLIEAFEIVRKGKKAFRSREKLDDIKLVICGDTGWMAEKIYKRAKESEFSKDIIFTGNVYGEELNRLYRNAVIFILPSLYEGFGLPVLEAMSWGVPSIVSDNSSLREIASDAALYVDAEDSSDIAEKLSAFLSNDNLRKDFSQRAVRNARKFSWIESAKKTLEVLSDV